MKCATCRELVSGLSGGELPAALAEQARAHVDRCADCARALEETAATVSLLRRLGDEELPGDFGAGLHRKLVAAGRPRRAGWSLRLRELADRLFPRPLAMAAVGAAAAVGVVLALPRPPLPSTNEPAKELAAGPVVPIYRVPQAKLAVVRIDFVAEQAIDDVEFAISLPEGLHFVSDGRVLPDREFRWRGRLEQGSNPIPVAVRGDHAGRFIVAARVTGTDLDAKQKVLLEVISG